MRKIIIIIALTTLIFGGWLYAQETKKPAQKEKTVTMTGIIRNDMMVIGGEITRFVLKRDKGGIQQLDHTQVGDLTRYVGKKVKVEGTIYYKKYIESGPTPILKIKEIKLLPTQQEKPSQKPETSPAKQGEVPPPGGGKLQAKIEELIKQLGDEDWKIREEAHKELTKIGQPALFPLIDTLDSEDPEIRLRVENILSQLESPFESVKLDTNNPSSMLILGKRLKFKERLREAKGNTKNILESLWNKWWIGLEGGTPVNGLQHTIKSDKKVYTFQENITIEFRFQNTGKKDIYFCNRTPWCIAYDAEITGPEGPIIKKTWGHLKSCQGLTKSEFVLLKPGEWHIEKLSSSFGEDKQSLVLYTGINFSTCSSWLLSKLGKYQIKMKYKNENDGKEFGFKAWTGEVTSNTITIEIKE